MSFAASQYIWLHSKMTGSARVLMLAIADLTNDESKKAWPKRETLAAYVHVNARHISELIAECERAGELVVVAKPGRSHEYYIVGYGTPQKPARPAPVKKERKRPTPATDSNATDDTPVTGSNATDTNTTLATGDKTPLLPVATDPLYNPDDTPNDSTTPPIPPSQPVDPSRPDVDTPSTSETPTAADPPPKRYRDLTPAEVMHYTAEVSRLLAATKDTELGRGERNAAREQLAALRASLAA